MQKRANPKKMDSLFNIGVSIVSIPTLFILVVLVLNLLSSPKRSTEVSAVSKEEKPVPERIIIHDTIRIEVPPIKPKKKKVISDSIIPVKDDSLNLTLTQDPS